MAEYINNNTADAMVSVAVSSSAIASSDPIDMRSFAGATVYTGGISTATTLTWYSCPTRDGTYLPLYDSSNTAATQGLTANASLAVHAACNACHYIKALCDNADITLSFVTRKSGG